MTKAKRKRNERRMLITAVILALIIVAGGTFAWFTSKDEVTNKLSASQKYNVSITETFTTPSSWVPGQEVNKDVSLINTGNIDAFVKLSINNEIALTIAGTPADTDSYDATKVDTYVALSADEVTAAMAGGHLVCKAGTATDENVSNYNPTTGGLYVFERSVDEAVVTDDKVEYAGFYFDGTKCYALASIEAATDTSVDPAVTTYTAKLCTVEKVALSQMAVDYTYAVADDNADTIPYIIATYAGKDTASKDDDVVINIILDETELKDWTLLADADTANNAYGTEGKAFYYNKTLAPASQTGNLITAVELDENVKAGAYITFDYNLTVKSDSVQTIPSKAPGKVDEVAKTVNGMTTWANVDKDNSTMADPDVDGNVKALNLIKWN